MNRTNEYLRIEHVCKTFGAGAAQSEVLRDVSLDVARGEYLAIIGHSGCGKSTLLNIVAGLTEATQGYVFLEGREVHQPGPDRAVVFQNHSLLPWLTVYDNVRLAVDKVFGSSKTRAERHEWTLRNLELVHMTHAMKKRPGEISGGMKQRVGIARALAMSPKVLLLDEPFGALDALTRAHLQEEVMKIHAELGNTVLMITHDVDEAVLLGPHRHDDQRPGRAHRRDSRGGARPSAQPPGVDRRRHVHRGPRACAGVPAQEIPLRGSGISLHFVGEMRKIQPR